MKEPFRTANSTETIGTLESDKTTTSNPFGKTLLTNGTSAFCGTGLLGWAATAGFELILSGILFGFLG